ncbi:MAG: ABC transporter permease [Gammaproteobacteria bacterium]|nr:ABC transporter permease [Gammaproteobacteria bacterium]CAJ2376459.1 MAG: ABC transporter permease [Arenicellales bacterium IbO2]MDA7961444.1 ABC transporter permease [Gammaproteobacteria bacterium]MDA7969598.1 ABC transporter permease [Gammaproteobacteria bacterium]MDA7971535.1 ABC transporter permease [Gammaproteobacteria bacterium]
MSQVLVTADGVPLKTSLARAQRRSKLKAVALVAPLFVFIAVAFFVPIIDMLFRSVENQLVGEVLHRSMPLLQKWDERSGELPEEEVFAALALDFREAKENKSGGRVGRRLNYEKPGFSGLFRKSARGADRMEAPYREAFIALDEKWGDIENWRVIKRESAPYTISYYLAALDMGYADDGGIARNSEDGRIYLKLFWRTLWMSLFITFLCLILAYPISYLLSVLPTAKSNLLIILVLLPFWTSLLVRTTAWIALLQQEGVINDLVVWFGLVDDDNRLAMIHNRTGTIIAMVHILLPFMVLPLYSVMKTIPPSYMRAAKSLGATPFTAFVRVYMPNTVAGIGAGAILVFILAIGYYITPALVGGQSGTLISNFIAFHMQNSLNWGLAAALGAILLGVVLVLYFLYDKIVGIDNMKLG